MHYFIIGNSQQIAAEFSLLLLLFNHTQGTVQSKTRLNFGLSSFLDLSHN